MMTTVEIVLAILVAVLLAIELSGIRTTLLLRFRGDLARESLFLAQYGQAVCTIFAAWLVAAGHGSTVSSWPAWRAFILVAGPVLLASIVCTILKRICGRRRPRRENAGKFTGPGWRHDNERESFPSSHTACAVALSVALSSAWPQAAVVFWVLAIIVGLLRYALDAHFPSDVLAGCLLGLIIARAGIVWLDEVLPR